MTPERRSLVISDLRAVADLLERRPAMPVPFIIFENVEGLSKVQRFSSWQHSLDDMRAIARSLGTFKKRYNDSSFELVVEVSPTMELVFYCDRDKVCKKTVIYDCEDAEKILLTLPEPEAAPVDPVDQDEYLKSMAKPVEELVNADDIPF